MTAQSSRVATAVAKAEEIGAELVKLEAAIEQFTVGYQNGHLGQDRRWIYEQPLLAALSVQREVLRGRLLLLNKRLP